MMEHFRYEHLPEDLRSVSKQVAQLASWMEWALPDCEEKKVGMRKLLEAKDCFVRAKLEERKE